MIKKLSWSILIIYLVALTWVILFKLSISYSDIINQMHNQSRSINVIPFGKSSIVNGSIGLKEIIFNIVLFFPFGVLLSIVKKETSLLHKGLIFFFFSLMLEFLQLIFSLGTTDITDVIMNTIGGLLGVLLYSVLKKIIPEKKLDRILVYLSTAVLCLVILFILFLLRRNI